MEKAEAGGIGGLGGGKKKKILQLYVMSYDASWRKRWKSHAITNEDVSFCCGPSVRSVLENNPHTFGSYQTSPTSCYKTMQRLKHHGGRREMRIL